MNVQLAILLSQFQTFASLSKWRKRLQPSIFHYRVLVGQELCYFVLWQAVVCPEASWRSSNILQCSQFLYHGQTVDINLDVYPFVWKGRRKHMKEKGKGHDILNLVSLPHTLQTNQAFVVNQGHTFLFHLPYNQSVACLGWR